MSLTYEHYYNYLKKLPEIKGKQKLHNKVRRAFDKYAPPAKCCPFLQNLN